MAEPLTIHVESDDETVTVDPDTGAKQTLLPGGNVLVNLDDHRRKSDDGDGPWFANLADKIDAMELARIANELIDEIEADNRSRLEHLQIVARGLGLLGL